MSEKGKKEEKIKFTIQGKEYQFTSDQYRKDGVGYYIFNEPKQIQFKIGDIENVLSINKYLPKKKQSNINLQIFKGNDLLLCEGTISFKIGDVLNKGIKISRITIFEEGFFDYYYFDFRVNDQPQKISFKIGNVSNKDIPVAGITVDNELQEYIKVHMPDKYDEYNEEISFKVGGVLNTTADVKEVQFNDNINDNVIVFFKKSFKTTNANFKIRDTNYYLYLKQIEWSNKNGLIKGIQLWKNEGVCFYYNDKKYELNFYDGEEINFDKYGQLTLETIRRSPIRMKQIEEQDRLYKLEEGQKNLENKQAVATFGDWFFVFITGFIGLYCVAAALGLCFGKAVLFVKYILPDNFDKMTFNYNLLFLINRYTFLYEILKRTPIIILIILGFKFLQLAFERLRLIGKVEQVRNYIALTADDDTKKQLLKMIAVPFFAPKKVKSSFFDKLIEKLFEVVKPNFEVDEKPNNQPKNDGNQGT